MFCLVADSYLNAAVLFKGKRFIGMEYEQSYSCYNEFPVFSIKMLLDKFHLLFSDIDNFIFLGEDKQRFNALLNLNLLELYDHNNRKEIISIEKKISETYYSSVISGFIMSDVFLWDKDGISSYYYSKGNLSKTIFSLDENSDIAFFTQLIIEYFGDDYKRIITMSGFNEGLEVYQNIREQAFDFNADGRVYIKREKLENIFEELFKNEKFGYSIKKIIDDVIIHLSNYMKYLTKNNNIVYCGDFSVISFGNRKMLNFIPYREHFVEFSHNPSYRAEGAVCKFLTEKENFTSEKVEIENIKKIIIDLFEDFNSEDVQRISKYFYYMDDEVLNNIRHAIDRCNNIKMNFVLKDVALSSSGVKGWGLFYFYFFGKFKESGLPVIYNYKVMMFVSRENEWKISDIEFYSFDNLPILTIELANCCNYKCIMCDTNMQKNRAFMTFETFRHIIDSLKGFRVGTITPFWLGEPLMNPDFDRMIDYAFSMNENNNSFVSFTINTNGSLLDCRKTDTILKNAALSNMNSNTFIRIHFSLDSIIEDTYSTIHRAGSAKKVIDNIIYFLKARKKQKSQYPKVTVAIIVMEQNYREVKDFVEYWKKIFSEFGDDYYVTWDWPYMEKDAIYIRRLDSANQEESERLHYNTVQELGLLEEKIIENEDTKTYESFEDLDDIKDNNNIDNSDVINEEDVLNRRIINTDSVLVKENMDYFVRRPCPALWKTPIVNWNGEITTCCFDIDLQMRLGNINEKPLSEIWNSELIVKWRLYHLRGEFNKIKRCSCCHNINSPVMKNSEFIEYLLNISKKQEIEKTHFLK